MSGILIFALGAFILLGIIFIYISVEEGDNFHVFTYLVGAVIGALLIIGCLPTNSQLAEQYDVNLKYAETIAEAAEIPTDAVLDIIYYLDLSEEEIQDTFNFTDEEMTAIKIWLEKGKK